MKILLDTHTFIWWADEPDRLSPTARAILTDTANTLLFSMASLWEMQIKISLGKMRLSRPLKEHLARQQIENSLQILPIEPRHLWALETLPDYHKDPFDRLLIAKSMVEDMPLLSRDERVSQYDIKVLW